MDDNSDLSAPAPARIPVVARVAHIRDLMARDLWHRRMIPGLAAEWGVSEGNIRQCSTEASRHLTMHDETGADLAAARELLAAAAQDAAEVDEPGDRAKTRVAVAGGYTRLAGTVSKGRVIETTGEAAAEDFDAEDWANGRT